MFPLAWSVTVRTLAEGPDDDYGNPTQTPKDRTERVYGWAPAGSSEVNLNAEQVTHDLDLYVPPTFAATPSDTVKVLDDWYEVQGRVQDFSHGPFGWAPGGLVRLERVTG